MTHPILFVQCYEAIIDEQKVSCQFTVEVLQDLQGVSAESLAEFCKDRIQKVAGGSVLSITTDDLRRFRASFDTSGD